MDYDGIKLKDGVVSDEATNVVSNCKLSSFIPLKSTMGIIIAGIATDKNRVIASKPSVKG